MCVIRTFGDHEPPALSFVRGKNAAAMGATGECNAGPISGSVTYLMCIHFYQLHQALWYRIIFLQMVIIFKGQQYWVQWYAFKQVTSGHDINRSFVWKFDHEDIEIWRNDKVQDQASAYNKFYIIWSAFS